MRQGTHVTETTEAFSRAPTGVAERRIRSTAVTPPLSPLRSDNAAARGGVRRKTAVPHPKKWRVRRTLDLDTTGRPLYHTSLHRFVRTYSPFLAWERHQNLATGGEKS